MTASPLSETVLPEYIADSIGAPFKVVLKNSVKQTVDLQTGDIVKTTIPNPKGLLRQIALTRLVCQRKLSGPEIKFIRKALGLKAAKLAALIEVTPEHLSRCEGGERVLSPGSEKCLRLTVLLHTFKLPDGAEEACETNENLRRKLEIFKSSMQRLQDLINAMHIASAHDSSEELVLGFMLNRQESNSISSPGEDVWGDGFELAA